MRESAIGTFWLRICDRVKPMQNNTVILPDFYVLEVWKFQDWTWQYAMTIKYELYAKWRIILPVDGQVAD